MAIRRRGTRAGRIVEYGLGKEQAGPIQASGRFERIQIGTVLAARIGTN